jgi:hypothetical protein
MTNSTNPLAKGNTASSSDHLKVMAQVAVDLHIARRNFLIYPVTHEQALRSLDRAYERLGIVLARRPSATLVVLKEGLAVGKKVLPAKNTVFKELAALLKQYQIVTLTFTKGLEKDELVRFLQLIVTDREAIQRKGGMDAAVQQAGLSHILVQMVDYSQLQVTDERQIARSSAGKKKEASIWQQFVTRLTVTDQAQGGTSFDPGKLAGMLNDQTMDAAVAVNQYEAIFTAVANSDERRASLSEGLPQFQQMIKGLKPNLQKQFLSATFDQCDQLATMADTAHLIDGLGGELIIGMLQQASSENKKISPSLLAFVKKMAHFGDALSAPTAAVDPVTEDKVLGSGEVETLLAHEQYDHYVDKGYGELLEKIVAQRIERVADGSGNLLQQDLAQSLMAVHVNTHVGRAMLALMNNSHNIAGYREWARQLAYLLDDLLESQAYLFLADIMARFGKVKAAGDPEKAKIAGLVLARFGDPQFVARAVEIARSSGDEVDPKALAFLLDLGEPVVVEIFEGLDPNETFFGQNSISAQLLDNLASITAREALERLDDPRPDYVRRMIRIIRRMGDGQIVEQVRALLEHADFDARMEALATLLKFRNKWGLIRLREILGNPLAPEFQKAIQLAGHYKVVEALPLLIAYAERGGGDRERQEAALRALGNIGDPRVVPLLDKLARRRVFKKESRHIKRVVFETLDGYPAKEINDLLHFGLKQKDAAISSSCEQVLRKRLQP